MGLFSKPPPQFGQTFFSLSLTHSQQKVHSKLQIMASWLSFGNGLAQFSQLGLISNTDFTFEGNFTLVNLNLI
jgi:hypothetical protein